jgi:flap endonuclease-1
MGLKFKDIVVSDEITIDMLSGKSIAIDGYNMLYQFLTTIRGPDGSLLVNGKGEVTSHLTGLFSRIITFLEKGIQPVFVFDGAPPALKLEERKRRRALKEEAQVAYDVASEREDLDGMKKFASRMTRITPEILNSTKKLLFAFGLPLVEAPSEGEAQVASLVCQGKVDYAVSQDFDTLLYGTPRLVRNLSLSNRRKKKGVYGTVFVSPELITLQKVLEKLDVTLDQLTVMAILTGTDYNYGGVKGIGPKKALGLVKKHGTDFDTLFSEVTWTFAVSWKEIYDLIKNMPVNKDVVIEFGAVDTGAVVQLLCDNFGFGHERIEKQLSRLDKVTAGKKQQSLSQFF